MTDDRTATLRARFLSEVGEMSRGIVARAFAGEASPRQAIKAMCLSCSGFERAEIEACAVVLCPLHAYRPRKGPGIAGIAPPDELCEQTAAAGVTLPPTRSERVPTPSGAVSAGVER